jgi:hypothetical protein
MHACYAFHDKLSSQTSLSPGFPEAKTNIWKKKVMKVKKLDHGDVGGIE